MTDVVTDPEAELVTIGRRAGLGDPVSFHHVVPRRTATAWLAPIGFVGMLALEAVWVVQWINDPDFWFVWAGLIALFMLFVLGFALAAVEHFSTGPESVSLHTAGLVRRSGTRDLVLAWADIALAEYLHKVVTVNGGQVGSVHYANVKPVEGPAFAIHRTLPGLDRVGPVVVEKVAEQRADAMLAAFAAGTPARREHSTLWPDGIDCAGDYFSYAELAAVDLDDQELVLINLKGRKVYREKVGPWLNSDLLAFVLVARTLVATHR